MAGQPTNTPAVGAGKPADREALALVLEALDIPHAATAGEEAKRRHVLVDRVVIAAVFLARYLNPSDSCPDEIRLSVFREMLTDRPATGYVTDTEARERRVRGESYAESVTYRGGAQ